MKSIFLLMLMFLLIGTANPSFSQSAINAQVKAALNLADSASLKANISYLADDKLLGREPGKPGYQLAVDHVIDEMKKYGIEPMGENGTWLQKLVFRKATINKAYTISLQGDTAVVNLQAEKDVFLYPNPTQKTNTVKGAFVFAGFGITSAPLNYDDYQNLDVKGKIVLVVRGAPERFSSSELAHFQSIPTIQTTALAHGAIGVMFCSISNSEVLKRAFNKPTNNVIDRSGKLLVSSTFASNALQITGAFTQETSNDFFSRTGKDFNSILTELKKGVPQSFAFGTRLEASYQSDYYDFDTYNVVGKIEGSDRELKNEYVVHSAHLDHIGVGEPIEGDSIYNGAHDNASGVACVLQIAKIYTGIKVKPKRSILILMVTGEESGLLGSAYFALRPTVNIKQIVANVNTDMPTIIAPLLSITALGADHSSLNTQVKQAADFLGLPVEADPEPKERRFVRSDQYSFVKQGIPALHIKYGNKTADGQNNLNLAVEKWRARYYHKPQDDMNGVFDFTAGCTYSKLNFLIGYLIANETKKPTWNPGDAFAIKAEQ